MKDMQQHEEDIKGTEMMMMKEVKEESRNFAESSPDHPPTPPHHHLPLVEEMDIPETDSIFYGDDFPSLPDFACITSSSSSSSALPPTRTSSTSSVSTAWAVVKAEREESGDLLLPENHPGMEDLPPPPLEGMDVLDELGNLGLLDDTEIWDPATLFPDEEAENFLQSDGGNNGQSQEMVAVEGETEGAKKAEEKQPSEDLAMVFFEWLKTNKDSISPEDLRSIKLKRSTIECAAKRLGGGKEGMMQLLKLILAWVQNHHLQKKKNKAEEQNPTPFQYQNTPPYPQFPVQVPLQIPSQNPNPNVDSWVHPSPQVPPFPPMMMGYVGPGPTSAMTRNFPPPPPPPPPHDYRNPMIDPNAAWAAHFAHYGGRYGDHPPPAHPPSQAGYMGFGSNYGVTQLYNGERFVRMASSATKEARKKRMARQRRLYTHHHHRHHNQHHSRLSGDGSCTQGGGTGNWVLFPTAAAPPPFGTTQPMIMPEGGAPLSSVSSHVDSTAIQVQQQQRHISSERRQIYKRREFFHQYLQGGWKPEKNLRFLLQKVLKQSDVGNLGRIVLPKKEAETHLPELDARDGISIPMEDIGSSRIWNMRYRYWPNNKSRMYLLENTGDFVRSNGLQEGDFIVIYSDAKCTKYMIRGVKVRKPELKPEGKPPGKARKITTLHANPTGDGVSVPP